MNRYRTILLAILILINSVSIFYVGSRSLERDNEMLQLVASSTNTTRNIENEILKIQITQQVSLGAISEDYPPKKDLADREWCKERVCLNEVSTP